MDTRTDVLTRPRKTAGSWLRVFGPFDLPSDEDRMWCGFKGCRELAEQREDVLTYLFAFTCRGHRMNDPDRG